MLTLTLHHNANANTNSNPNPTGNARAVAFTPNGQTIVAGLGGMLMGEHRRNMAINNGSIVVISYLQGNHHYYCY